MNRILFIKYFMLIKTYFYKAKVIYLTQIKFYWKKFERENKNYIGTLKKLPINVTQLSSSILNILIAYSCLALDKK